MHKINQLIHDKKYILFYHHPTNFSLCLQKRSLEINSNSCIFTKANKIWIAMVKFQLNPLILNSCNFLFFYFCHGKGKVKKKRKADEKLCKLDIRNEFSISLVRITSSVNEHFCARPSNNISKIHF